MTTRTRKHRVVIVGAGFGGLAARESQWRRSRDHHHRQAEPSLFSPALSGGDDLALDLEIAWPVRHLLRKRRM
jgi:NADH dehydrogenase FAD-containing subunit